MTPLEQNFIIARTQGYTVVEMGPDECLPVKIPKKHSYYREGFLAYPPIPNYAGNRDAMHAALAGLPWVARHEVARLVATRATGHVHDGVSCPACAVALLDASASELAAAFIRVAGAGPALKPTAASLFPSWGTVTVGADGVDMRPWYRHDIEDCGPKERWDEMLEDQEMLRGFGWEMEEPQYEHDCISGFLVPYPNSTVPSARFTPPRSLEHLDVGSAIEGGLGL